MSDDIFDDLFGGTVKDEVVLVDDSETNLHLTSSILNSMGGMQCKTFLAPRPALSYIKNNKPSLVVTDQLMPGGLLGLDVINEIRAYYSKFDVPVIMMTGLEEGELFEKAYEVGANDFIVKPVLRANLMARTRAQIEMMKEYRRLAAKAGESASD